MASGIQRTSDTDTGVRRRQRRVVIAARVPRKKRRAPQALGLRGSWCDTRNTDGSVFSRDSTAPSLRSCRQADKAASWCSWVLQGVTSSPASLQAFHQRVPLATVGFVALHLVLHHRWLDLMACTGHAFRRRLFSRPRNPLHELHVTLDAPLKEPFTPHGPLFPPSRVGPRSPRPEFASQ